MDRPSVSKSSVSDIDSEIGRSEGQAQYEGDSRRADLVGNGVKSHLVILKARNARLTW